ncbi:MAG: hypothetical protein JO369_07995 [Paucibacter sp.]|nr:hypothetical protein [Roseateles sp.]
MDRVQIPLQLAPNTLYQPILPNWQVSLFSIDLGASSNAPLERAAIQQVGSYGKQLGHLAEALEVVIEKLQLLEGHALSRRERDALQVFLGDVAATRGLKQGRAAA